MPAAKAKQLYASKGQFWLGHEFFGKGRIVEEGDPVLEEHAALFEPYVPDVRGHPQVEAATAAPGEKRG